MENKSGVFQMVMGRAKVDNFTEEELIMGKTGANNLGVDLLELPKSGAVLE